MFGEEAGACLEAGDETISTIGGAHLDGASTLQASEFTTEGLMKMMFGSFLEGVGLCVFATA